MLHLQLLSLLLLSRHLRMGRLKRHNTKALPRESDSEFTVQLLLPELLLHRMLVVQRQQLRGTPTPSTSAPNSSR